MSKSVREVMTSQVIGLQADQTIEDAARAMRDHNVGDVMILEGDEVCGILTDRDIVVRAVAESRGFETMLHMVCTHDLATLRSTDSVDDAIALMREKSVRRLPVVDDGHAMGIVSLGDLAVHRDPASVLGEVSSAPPNT